MMTDAEIMARIVVAISQQDADPKSPSGPVRALMTAFAEEGGQNVRSNPAPPSASAKSGGGYTRDRVRRLDPLWMAAPSNQKAFRGELIRSAAK